MRILIVGGAGEVGRHLTSALSRRGDEVTVFDRAPTPSPAAGSPSGYVQGNVADAAAVREAVRDKDVVVHLAWSFSDDARTVFEEDIRGHLNVLDAASSRGTRVIYTSTATVYGRAAAHPVSEDHPCLVHEARKPLYALGKYVAEELSRQYAKERGLPVTILRFWWAFGDDIGGRHLRDLIRKALKREPLEMVRGAGGAFLTMEDLGRVVRAAIAKAPPPGRIYNVGSLFLTWEEIAQMILGLTRSTSPVRLVPPGEWKGPAFLNEIWDLAWDRAGRELDYAPGASPDAMRNLLSRALGRCIAKVERGET